MAEATDALTLVVSEERGVVAIAKANKIRAISLKDDLRNILNAHLGITEKENLSRRDFLEISITALASVTLVFGIWFNLVKGNTTLITVDASIQLINNDSGTELLSMEPNTVSLQLSGSDRLMRSFRPEQAQVRLDISKAHIGSNFLSIRNEDISLPPGIVLSRIDQASIKIELDKQMRKKLPVKVNWTGKLPADLVLKTVTIVPEFIEITGMSRIIDEILFVPTEAVDQSGMLASGSITVVPLLTATGISFTSESKPKIIITYVIESKNLKH
jgi:YbbR domain-containing protein